MQFTWSLLRAGRDGRSQLAASPHAKLQQSWSSGHVYSQTFGTPKASNVNKHHTSDSHSTKSEKIPGPIYQGADPFVKPGVGSKRSQNLNPLAVQEKKRKPFTEALENNRSKLPQSLDKFPFTCECHQCLRTSWSSMNSLHCRSWMPWVLRAFRCLSHF